VSQAGVALSLRTRSSTHPRRGCRRRFRKRKEAPRRAAGPHLMPRRPGYAAAGARPAYPKPLSCRFTPPAGDLTASFGEPLSAKAIQTHGFSPSHFPRSGGAVCPMYAQWQCPSAQQKTPHLRGFCIGAPRFELGTSPTRIARIAMQFVMKTPANQLVCGVGFLLLSSWILGSFWGGLGSEAKLLPKPRLLVRRRFVRAFVRARGR
jgi:hypothetical protein